MKAENTTDKLDAATKDWLEKNQLVGKQLIDKNEFLQKDKLQGNKLLSLTLALIIHLVIIALVIYAKPQFKAASEDSSIETSLLSSDDLASLQEQIRSNQQQAANANNANNTDLQAPSSTVASSQTPANKPTPEATKPVSDNKPATPTVSQKINQEDIVFTPSKQALEMEAKIAAQEREFTEALREFSEKEEEKAKAKILEQEKALEEQRQLELQKVEELKQAEQTAEEIVEQNKQELEKTAEMLKAQLEEAERQEAVAKNLAADGKRLPSSGKAKSQPASKSSGNKRSDLTDGNAVSKKILENLVMPAENLQGIKTVLTVYIDKQGYVIDVSATGASTALNTAGKNAVINASPLPIEPSDSRFYPKFSFPIKGT